MERLAKIQDTLQKRKAKISEEEIQILKILFHEVPQLDFIPKTLWGRITPLLSLRKAKEHEKVISAKDENRAVPCYIVLTGCFRTEDEKFMPGDIFGNYELLNGQKWPNTNVIATEASAAAVFSPLEVSQLIEQENSNISYKAFITFLGESIPKFDQLSGNLRDRLCKLFVEKTYIAGKEIISEDTKPTCAYLIREGRCNVMSAKNPLQGVTEPGDYSSSSANFDEEKLWIQRNSKKLPRGYMSTSTSTYQLRTIGEKEWFGEEILIDDFVWKNIAYSAIAAVKTTVLTITKESLDKFPSDVLDQIKRNAREKLQWQAQRKKELSSSIMKISKMNALGDYVQSKHTRKNKRQILLATATTTTNRGLDNSLMKLGEIYGGGSRGNSLKPTGTFSYSANNTGKKLGLFDRVKSVDNQAKGLARMNNRVTTAYRKPPPPSASFYPDISQSFMAQSFWKDLDECFKADVTNYFGGEQNKRLLEAASTFRTVYKRKMFCPTVSYRPRISKRPTTESPTKSRIQNALLVELNENLKSLKDSFVVGVKEVKAISTTLRRRPPSPNPANTWANKTGFNLYSRLNKTTNIL